MAACKYITDGVDTDGTTWHRCLTHDELAPSADAACARNDDSPARVADLWTWDNDYGRAWAPTTDPRVLAVIQRQDYPDAPDGDVFAPAYWFARGHTPETAGSTYQDSDALALAERYAEARDYFVNWHYGRRDGHRQLDYDRMLARWLRIFHDASAVKVRSTVHQSGDSILLLNTPAWREHVGATEPTTWRVTSVTAPGQGFAETAHDVATEAEARAAHLAELTHDDDGNQLTPAETRRITSAERVSILAGDVETWQAYLDGDVFGIGYAILDDPEDGLNDVDPRIIMTSWGLYGEEDAQRAALEEALLSAADELKRREEAEAATARELAELAQREREAAVDRADLAAGLKGLDSLIGRARASSSLSGDAVTVAQLTAYTLNHWPAAARFVAAVDAETNNTPEV